ncbi:hypothetical protein POM88_011826 [Heracleum sosnowskyi]|uniref:Uncharacterized protein n=1 Tax=Heracleum sosnowskyi TaxID=360622 RepID=A0AAD8IZ50_9APIA|nr:hypothetical protein POM88_011826 [Heracleum sosnowskyi]
MVVCERQAYDDFCKNHPKAGGLWMTHFPYIEKLDLIFGVDRANDTSYELPEDSIQNLEETVNLDNDYSDDDAPLQSPAKKIKKEKTPKSYFMKDMSSHLATIMKSMKATQEREIEVVEQKKNRDC